MVEVYRSGTPNGHREVQRVGCCPVEDAAAWSDTSHVASFVLSKLCYTSAHSISQLFLSDIRQVPDTQEVFLSRDSDISYIIEILESVEADTCEGTAR